MTLIPYAGKDSAEVPFKIAFIRGAPKSGINPRLLEGREKLIAISREYQRRQDERKAEEAALQQRIREQVARDKAKWQSIAKAPRAKTLKHEEIISMVAFWHGLAAQDIYDDNRTDIAVRARHDAMVAVWLNCKLEGRVPNLTSLGRAFKRDHTTCLFALRKHGIRSNGKAWAGRPS